ncbi:MAG: hypothetical protein GX331_00100 [Firmicutes bacterium]|jgi:Fe-S cluster assembly iron-binding protein IscA|nr:hypothetical protein [Bacillota bacterium]
MSLEETEEMGDTVVESSGFKFLLDPQAMKYAQGAVVDYRKTIFGKGFSIKTNHSSQC